MKAFTVYQPYAHAIVAGIKHYISIHALREEGDTGRRPHATVR